MTIQASELTFDNTRYGFRDEENYVYKSAEGLNEQVVRELSGMKGEPKWMLRRRLQALAIFFQKPTPLLGAWANPALAELDYQNIHYFVRAGEKPQTDWDAVPQEIKNTFEKLGIPETERKFLAGVGAQYESEVVYHSLRAVLDDLGLAVALANYVEQWSMRASVAVDLHTSDLEGGRLPLAVESTLYRLVQETLTNILKHAQATGVSLILERNHGEVRLIVEDDGVGFDVGVVRAGASAAQRLGLVGMDERVTQLGGTLTIESTPGRGTTVFVSLPLPPDTSGARR